MTCTRKEVFFGDRTKDWIGVISEYELAHLVKLCADRGFEAVIRHPNGKTSPDHETRIRTAYYVISILYEHQKMSRQES